MQKVSYLRGVHYFLICISCCDILSVTRSSLAASQ